MISNAEKLSHVHTLCSRVFYFVKFILERFIEGNIFGDERFSTAASRSTMANILNENFISHNTRRVEKRLFSLQLPRCVGRELDKRSELWK